MARKVRVRRSRIIGATLGGTIGFLVGSGTGIVGGPFVAMAGVVVFTAIGIGWGLSAGPDLVDRVREWRTK